jgi:hypothetical protein
MAQYLTTSQITTNIPQAYPFINVISTPTGVTSSGILVIFGEADGGPSYQVTALKNNFFTPNQLNAVKQKYISGQIVDAFQALTAPSADADILGSANQIFIVKTNQGTQASAVLANTYGTLSDKNFGLPGNNYKYQITSIAAEDAPAISGTTIPALGAPLNGVNFAIRTNGGASSTVTLSATPSEHDTIPHLVTELNQYTFAVTAANATVGATYTNNGQTFTVVATIASGTTLLMTATGAPYPVATGSLVKTSGTGDTTIAFSAWTRVLPVGVSASAGGAPSSIELSIDTDSAAYGKGYGKTLELIEVVPGDLAALGLSPGMTNSSQEPGVELDITNATTGLSQSIDVTAVTAIAVGYLGTTGTLTINATTLTTTVTGGTGANLSIPLSQFKTCSDLAAFIASQPGYSAVCLPAAQQVSPFALDEVTAIGIASTGAGLTPGRIKMAASAWNTAANNSALAFAAGAGGAQGLPSPTASPAYLTGGTRGGTLAADIVNVLAQLGGIQCNIIVPCFSQDASLDIAAGLTDSSSTYTIAAINAATKSHCLEFSTPALKHNRTAILSLLDVYQNDASQAQSLGTFRCSLTMQQITQVNSQGLITLFQPWYAAVIAAGMQAGGFYKSILNKAANIISYTDPVGFDSGDPGDVSAALNAGLLFLSTDTGRAGYWVSDQTTYGFDTNFVYNSVQAVYTSDLIALDLAQSFFLNFIGKSEADVDAGAGLAYLAQKMAQYKTQKLIAASSDAPLGYKNQSVDIAGPTMTVNVEIKLATAIYFIPINISISQVQSAA